MENYIADPIEIMKRQIENQIDLVDKDGNYPCPQCGKKFPVEEGFPCDASPSAPIVCLDCAPEWFKNL